MPSDLLMRIHGPEFRAMSERVLEATALTSRLNVLPFDDEDGWARRLEEILGRPRPPLGAHGGGRPCGRLPRATNRAPATAAWQATTLTGGPLARAVYRPLGRRCGSSSMTRRSDSRKWGVLR